MQRFIRHIMLWSVFMFVCEQETSVESYEYNGVVYRVGDFVYVEQRWASHYISFTLVSQFLQHYLCMMNKAGLSLFHFRSGDGWLPWSSSSPGRSTGVSNHFGNGGWATTPVEPGCVPQMFCCFFSSIAVWTSGGVPTSNMVQIGRQQWRMASA